MDFPIKIITLTVKTMPVDNPFKIKRFEKIGLFNIVQDFTGNFMFYQLLVLLWIQQYPTTRTWYFRPRNTSRARLYLYCTVSRM
jgi:hypothetical protein